VNDGQLGLFVDAAVTWTRKRVETSFEGFEMTGLKLKLKTCSEAEALAKKV
jgi:hypothetical protein